MMRTFLLIGMCLMCLTSCAKVGGLALDVGGRPLPDAAQGIRYYEPHPYLLVLKLPEEEKTATGSAPAKPAGANARMAQNSKGGALKKKGTKKSASPSSGSSDSSSADDSSDTGSGSPAGGSSDGTKDSSSSSGFSQASSQYAVKLIYLPDYSRPYALTSSAGLSGSSAMKPVLQDGWMLTSLDASSQNQPGTAISALSGLVSSVVGPNGMRFAEAQPTQAKDILSPGLYRFEYNQAGYFVGLKRITGFCNETGQNEPKEVKRILLSNSMGDYLSDRCEAEVPKTSTDMNPGVSQ